MKGKVRDIIIGILTGTVMIFIGYNLNDYLAKERISIEHVEFVPEMKMLSVKPKFFSPVINSQRFSMWLSFLQTGAVQKLFYTFQKDAYSPSEVNILVTAIKEFIKYLDKDFQDSRILERKLKKYKINDDLDAIAEEARLIFLYDFFYYGEPEKIINNIKQNLNKRISGYEYNKKCATILLNYLTNFQALRTGGIDITIIFLNSGNTDGLIMPEGTLELVGDGRKERMPIALKESKVMKIEKRSMMEVSFIVDEGKAVHNELDNFKELIKKGFPISGVIEIKDFRTDVIRSKTYSFPVGNTVP
jgi:hypothetical protein